MHRNLQPQQTLTAKARRRLVKEALRILARHAKPRKPSGKDNWTRLPLRLQAIHDRHSWRGLARSVDARLVRLGVVLPKRERSLLGNLEDLDLRCQTMSIWVEALADAPTDSRNRKQTKWHIALLLAEVLGLRQCAASTERQLGRLIQMIDDHHDPITVRSHIKKPHKLRNRLVSSTPKIALDKRTSR